VPMSTPEQYDPNRSFLLARSFILISRSPGHQGAEVFQLPLVSSPGQLSRSCAEGRHAGATCQGPWRESCGDAGPRGGEPQGQARRASSGNGLWATLVALVSSAGAVPISYSAFGRRRPPLIRLPASGAEGQVAWTGLSPRVTGRRLVSFLVSYMFVYLRLSPSTAGP
jgi:hypothetical protein